MALGRRRWGESEAGLLATAVRRFYNKRPEVLLKAGFVYFASKEIVMARRLCSQLLRLRRRGKVRAKHNHLEILWLAIALAAERGEPQSVRRFLAKYSEIAGRALKTGGEMLLRAEKRRVAIRSSRQ
jgi:hypothetical protein